MRLPFQQVRHELNRIARRSWETIAGAEVISADALASTRLAGRDRVLFTDDDDWFSAQVADTPADAVWGSAMIGRFLHPPERAAEPVLTLRNFNGVVFTNNASISGATLRVVGIKRMFDHGAADAARRRWLYRPQRLEAYLSCANKHPCCTTAILHNMRSEAFRGDLRGVVAAYVEALEAPLPEPVAWIADYRRELRDVFRWALDGG
jgi:hypothetical protein